MYTFSLKLKLFKIYLDDRGVTHKSSKIINLTKYSDPQ